MKMQNFLEYLYKPFIETCFFLYNFVLWLWYLISNKKVTDKNKHKLDGFYRGNKTFNQSKISSAKWYLAKNFPWVLKFGWNCIILWVIYKLIVSLGLVEIVKLFVK